MSFLSELKRRNVFRAAAAYMAIGWLVLQVVEVLLPAFGFGDAAMRTALILLAVGFVPAMVVAWAFELTPDGVVRDAEVDRAAPAIRSLAKRQDRLVMVALALALGYFAVDKFMLDPARDRERERAVAEAAEREGRVTAMSEARASARTLPILAALPFTAMGDGEDSALLAGGVHEDLLTQLAQLSSLRVLSRSAAMEYRDSSLGAQAIGRALGATAVLEGSVRSAGDRVRINATLTDVETGESLWAERFDEDLNTANLFDVQATIARAISAALEAALTAEEEAALTLIPTRSMAAYRAYHEALRLQEANWTDREPHQSLLREALALDPDFTRAAAELVGTLANAAFGRDAPAAVAEAEQLIEQIAGIAPGTVDHLVAQAYYAYYIVQDYDLALGLITSALEKKPSDARLVQLKSFIERRLGDYDAVIESLRLARQLDPRNVRLHSSLLGSLRSAHRYDEALVELDTWERAPGPNLAMIRSELAFHEHRDLDRLRRDVEAVYQEFGAPQHRFDVWFMRVATRDYQAAFEFAAQSDPDQGHMGVPDRILFEAATAWLQGDRDAVDARLRTAREIFDDHAGEGMTAASRPLLGAAMLEALGGYRDEAEALVRRWYREGARDWPERVTLWDFSCMILGVAGAAEATVECLRTGLEQPSRVVPYLDPLLPFYDGIRDTPEFVALMNEIGLPSATIPRG